MKICLFDMDSTVYTWRFYICYTLNTYCYNNIFLKYLSCQKSIFFFFIGNPFNGTFNISYYNTTHK